ncbi:MAG: 1 protein [Dehalococcoidales bacterium]|nr:1 protein [Dehalococcoidales bacterium]
MPNPFISIRVPPEIIKSLDEVAVERGITRPDLIRELLANCHSFYRFIETEKARQQTDRITLDDNLSEWILNHMPEEMTPEWVHFLGEVMHHVADKLVAQKQARPE